MSEAGPSTPRAASITDIPADSTRGFERWRRSISHFTGLGLSEDEQAERSRVRQEAKLDLDYARCEQWKEKMMTQSPMIVFMLKHLKLSNCPFTTDSIQCHPCPDTLSGGFSPDYGVLLCQDRFFSKKHLEDTLAHELIHAFDHCRFNVQYKNLRHHACTEIRAANLSGDCRWGREIQRGFYSFSRQHQACVKRRATTSVQANPLCENREMAEKAVNEVWESCFKDTRPFEEVY